MLELVKWKPKEDILGLPHSSEGYAEAKKILVDTYEKPFMVQKALIKDLEQLKGIRQQYQLREVHEFYNPSSRIIRSLNTTGKLSAAQSHVYTLLNKLGPVRKIITQEDDEWEQWGLEDLINNLKGFVERNPLTTNDELKDGRTNHYGKFDRSNRNMDKGDMLLLVKRHNQGNSFKTKCVYCNLDNHRSSECMKVITIADRKEMIKKQKLCYNCCKFGHQASKCPSRGCRKCGVKHHTCICDKIDQFNKV